MTAYRLPDQFSPDVLGATAATPTCCCCCCCCLTTTLTTPIVLHGAMRREVERAPQDAALATRRANAPGVMAMIWIALVAVTVATVFGSGVGVAYHGYLIVGLAIASIAGAWFVAREAGVRPVRASVRMLVGIVAFAAETWLMLYVVMLGLYLIVAPAVLFAALIAAVWAYRR